jgi:hypothetical protein
MPQKLLHAQYECEHARKVTRKGGNLKTKFFAPVPSPDERARQSIGLAAGALLLEETAKRVLPVFGSRAGRDV